MTFNSQQSRFLLTVLTKRYLNSSDFLPNYGNAQTNYFFVANEMTSLQAYNLTRYFLTHKSVKTNRVTITSKY